MGHRDPIGKVGLVVMRTYHLEVLLEVWRITERKSGAVYKAEYVEDRWIPIGADRNGPPDSDRDLQWVAKSTSFKGKTFRSVKY